MSKILSEQEAALKKEQDNNNGFDPSAGAPGSFAGSDAGENSPTECTKNKDEQGFEFPAGYGDNRITLMVRDPWTVFSFWEMREDVIRAVKEEIYRRGAEIKCLVLRVYDVTGYEATGDMRIVSDIELKDWISSWYIHGDPGKDWVADIGILCTNGEFFRIARSNVVSTPLNRMSDVCDQEWMCPEDLYYKLFTAAGGHELGKSSLEISELMERHLRKWLSSGGVTSALFGSASFALHKRR